MKSKLGLQFAATLVGLWAVSSSLVHAQSPDVCKVFLDKPIVTVTTTQSSASQKENFRLLQCSSDFKSAADAQKVGIEATVPIYDLPVPITANWDQNKVETWKSSKCTAAERAGSASLYYYQSVYAANPVSANDALACYQAYFSSQGNEALRCDLTETSNSYLFSARWRRTAGEAGAGPTVKQFTALNAQCLNAIALDSGTVISEGGIPVLCTVGKDAAAFALTTDRGGCSASGRYRAPKLVMPLKIVLSAPFFQLADEMEFPSGAEVVTNGYPFSVSSTRLVLTGPISIKSYLTAASPPNSVGNAASTVAITAKELVGVGGITVLNAGQNGGAGSAGPKGPPGETGAGGEKRNTQLSNVCNQVPWPFNEVCKLVPVGCEGGRDGSVGGQGKPGYAGSTGLAGGGGGPVLIDVDTAGRKLMQVLVDTGLDGKPMTCGGGTCGGQGGAGGQGGEGGDGGQGGPGASGTTYCGGTNTGPTGPKGGGGPQGPQGPAGTPGQVRG